MTVICFFTIAYILFAIWFMKVRIAGHSKKDVVLKMLAALCFVAIGITATVLNPSVTAGVLLAGGVFGALGDLSLGLSHLDKEKKARRMFAGVFWFGLGHIMFCFGLIHEYTTAKCIPHLLIPAVIGILAAVFVGCKGRKIGLHFGRYLPVVVVYVFLLCFSVALAMSFNLYWNFENRQLRIFLAGILFFIVSDSILSKMYFGKQKHPALNVVTNHVTYYVAQWLIAVSILFL